MFIFFFLDNMIWWRWFKDDE